MAGGPARGAVSGRPSTHVVAVLVLILEAAASALAQDDGFRLNDLLPPGDDLRWEDVSSWRDLPSGSVWCGYQYLNDETSRRERSYVARVYRIGSLVPGKVTYWGASAAVANSTFNSITTYEVAVVNPRRVLWVAASNGNVPAGAPVAGLSREGTPLYACKFHSDRRMSMACGAVQRYSERCVAEMEGSLVSSPVYEVMTLLPVGGGPPNAPLLPIGAAPSFAAAFPGLARYGVAVDDDQMPRPAGRQK